MHGVTWRQRAEAIARRASRLDDKVLRGARVSRYGAVLGRLDHDIDELRRKVADLEERVEGLERRNAPE